MNASTFATANRERKTICLARTIESVAARLNGHHILDGGTVSADHLCDFVSGLSDKRWQQVVDLANATHDCGRDHGFPSEETQADVVHHFTVRANAADQITERLAVELAFQSERATRRMQVVR